MKTEKIILTLVFVVIYILIKQIFLVMAVRMLYKVTERVYYSKLLIHNYHQ